MLPVASAKKMGMLDRFSVGCRICTRKIHLRLIEAGYSPTMTKYYVVCIHCYNRCMTESNTPLDAVNEWNKDNDYKNCKNEISKMYQLRESNSLASEKHYESLL